MAIRNDTRPSLARQACVVSAPRFRATAVCFFAKKTPLAATRFPADNHGSIPATERFSPPWPIRGFRPSHLAGTKSAGTSNCFKKRSCHVAFPSPRVASDFLDVGLPRGLCEWSLGSRRGTGHARSGCLRSAADAAKDNTDASIAQSVKDLDSDLFATRQAAVQKLKDAGLPAVGPVAEAAKGSDLEVTAQAIEILRQGLKSDQTPTREAAKAALEKLAKGDNSAASQAREALAPPPAETPKPRYAQPFRGQIGGFGGGGIQIGINGQIQAVPGGAIRVIQIQQSAASLAAARRRPRTTKTARRSRSKKMPTAASRCG